MTKQHWRMIHGFLGAILALSATSADATTVQDLVRVKGHEQNVLMGLGIVVGLDGTGDESKDSLVAARPYATLLRNLGNPVASIDELAEADSYAIVQVTMTVPAAGIREGDLLDVTVSTMFNASSLSGGQLVVSLLRPPRPDSPNLPPMAMAMGEIIIEGENARRGRVRGGGQMLADIRTNPVSRGGVMTLVLKDQYAGYPAATAIAEAINEEFFLDGHSEVAIVEDAKNIMILLPQPERARPASFIASLLTINVDSSLIQTEARIVINEEKGIIAVAGNVAIDPVAITIRGLTISSVQGGAPGPMSQWAGLDTTDGSGRASTQLNQLLQALDQLQVTVEDRIAIVHELKDTGALHAEIVTK